MKVDDHKKIKPVFGKKSRVVGMSERNVVIVNLPKHDSEKGISYAQAALPIQNIMTLELADGYSAMLLNNGLQIPVKLSHDKLESALANAGGRVDLTLVTGRGVYETAPKIELASQNDVISNLGQHDHPAQIVNKPLKVHVFAYSDKNGMDSKYIAFMISDIDHAWKDHSSNGWGYLKLKNTKPFTHKNGFYFPMDKRKFMEKVNLTQMKGVGELDMREETRIKTKPAPPMPKF